MAINSKVDITPDRYSFEDCVKYPKVMAHHVKRKIDEGISGKEEEDRRGYPKVRSDETVPTKFATYQLNPNRNSQPRAVATHRAMHFLRQHPVVGAVTRMKDACLYPLKIKTIRWSNFAQYLHTFVVHYCELEGIERTSDLARDIELYVFYATYTDKGKDYPIIRCLHYKTIAGRSRFGKYVKKHFGQFLAKIAQNPGWKIFFDDLGKGKAPVEYLVLVELGLRSFGSDMYAMGSRAMESMERWYAVSVWRKREAYIAVIRLIRGHLNYPQWDCYTLEDYSERQTLNKTFLARHLPLSNGKSSLIDSELTDPPQWSNPSLSTQPPMKRPKKEPKRSQKESVHAAVATAAKPQVWDVENNCFVPF